VDEADGQMGDFRGSYMHQSIEDSRALAARIASAYERQLPTIDIELLTDKGLRSVIRLLMLPGEELPAPKDAGVIHSFILSSGNDTVNVREIQILIPAGGGRALVSLPY
jgi:hypothetical protein